MDISRLPWSAYGDRLRAIHRHSLSLLLFSFCFERRSKCLPNRNINPTKPVYFTLRWFHISKNANADSFTRFAPCSSVKYRYVTQFHRERQTCTAIERIEHCTILWTSWITRGVILEIHKCTYIFNEIRICTEVAVGSILILMIH